VKELTLAELRKHLGVTQVELAKRTGMSQGEISRLERRGNHKVSTLKRYLNALGCTAEFDARFPDRVVRLMEI
jgi:transcriptional regulator with XRE-family HTH domain